MNFSKEDYENWCIKVSEDAGVPLECIWSYDHFTLDGALIFMFYMMGYIEQFLNILNDIKDKL